MNIITQIKIYLNLNCIVFIDLKKNLTFITYLFFSYDKILVFYLINVHFCVLVFIDWMKCSYVVNITCSLKVFKLKRRNQALFGILH